MSSDLKRVVVLLPPEIYDALTMAAEARYESMSHIGRRLFTEWLIDNGYLEDKRPKKDDSTT